MSSFTCITSLLQEESCGTSCFTLIVKFVTTLDRDPTNFIISFWLKASATLLWLSTLCTHTKAKSSKSSYHQACLAISFLWVIKNVLATWFIPSWCLSWFMSSQWSLTMMPFDSRLAGVPWLWSSEGSNQQNL